MKDVQAFARAFATIALGIAIPSCAGAAPSARGADEDDVCMEVARACHPADRGSGTPHECHAGAHGTWSSDECVARRDECLRACASARGSTTISDIPRPESLATGARSRAGSG